MTLPNLRSGKKEMIEAEISIADKPLGTLRIYNNGKGNLEIGHYVIVYSGEEGVLEGSLSNYKRERGALQLVKECIEAIS